jgi:hypothetical protein
MEDPVNKTKSVIFTEGGLRESERLFNQHFVIPERTENCFNGFLTQDTRDRQSSFSRPKNGVQHGVTRRGVTRDLATIVDSLSDTLDVSGERAQVGLPPFFKQKGVLRPVCGGRRADHLSTLVAVPPPIRSSI